MDLQEAFDQGFEAVKGYVDRSLASQAKRMAAVERQNADLLEKLNVLAGKVAGLETFPAEMATEIAVVDRKAATVLDLRKDIEAVHKSIDALPRPDVAGMMADALAKSEGSILSQTNQMIDRRVALEIATLKPEPVDFQGMLKEAAAGFASVSGVPAMAEALAATQKAVDAQEARMAALVGETVERAVAALPAAQNGKDGDRGEKGEAGADGRDGRDGIGLADALIDRDGNLVVTTSDGRKQVLGQVVAKDADMTLIKGMIETMTEKAAADAVAALPVPKNGLDGKDGQDGAPGLNGKDAEPVTKDQIIEAVRSTDAVAVAVQQYIESNPPAPGKDGRDGVDGKDGAPGRDGADGKDGAPGLDGKDGAPGLNGKDGADGRDGEKGDPGERGDIGPIGEKGVPGKDGVGAAGALIDKAGNLILTLTDGTTRELGIVIGKDGVDGAAGKDGKDGADGIGFDDVQQEIEDEGRFIVQRWLKDGVVVREIRLQTKSAIWRGVYAPTKTYLPGDLATWKGSVWHCNKEVTGKIGSEFWSLAVKKGRDAPEGGQA